MSQRCGVEYSIDPSIASLWGNVDWTSISKAIETFLAAPAGQLLLLITFVAMVLWGAYALRRLEISNARGKREADLEKQRLDIEQRENERQAVNDASLKALLNEVVRTQSQLTAIVGRLEPKVSETSDLVRQTKDDIAAIAIRTSGIHTDLRRGVVTVAGKIDAANNESRARWETTQQITNNRSQEQIKAFHAIGDNLQTTLTRQDGLLDQVLHKLGDVVDRVEGLRTDIRANTNAHSNSAAREHDEIKALTDIKRMMDEILAGVLLLKKRGDTGKLNPHVVEQVGDKLALPTVAAVIPPPASFATPDTTPSTTPRKTGPLPPLSDRDAPQGVPHE